ncbi:MAG: hypothetical protein ACREKE_05385, partial [bacterium]
MLTATAGAPIPVVALRWYPAEPGDYRIKGYHVYRSLKGKGTFELRHPKAKESESRALHYDDPARVGAVYDYFVAAVDSLDREGAHSPLGTADLSALPDSVLAPPAVQGLTATSRENDIKLRWKRVRAWISPWSAYRVYRATSLAGLHKGAYRSLTASVLETLPTPVATPTAYNANNSGFGSSWFGSSSPTPTPMPSPTPLGVFGQTGATSGQSFGGISGTASGASDTASAKLAKAKADDVRGKASLARFMRSVNLDNESYFYFYDTPTAKKRNYYYSVTALDKDGRESPMGLTVEAMATGPLPPYRPGDLTATAKTEQVQLSWEPASDGTSPLSGYVLSRREIGSQYWRKVALLDLSATSYSDSLDGGFYDYRLAAFDSKGNTGEAAYIAASPTSKVLNNTLIITMPSAYADNPGCDTGLNLNILFDFYVGSLFESYTSPITHQSQSSIFQQLEIGTMTGDLKYAWLNDRGWVPGFATGLYTTALIGFGNGSSNVGISSSGGS